MVREVLEVESCFIRPLGVEGTRIDSSEDDPSSMPYDAGCYTRGDYVEVKGTSGREIIEWRRGRVAADRKNGLYDVRMENGRDAVGVEASRLRHHFRSKDTAEVRLQGSFDWRPVLVKRQDKDGSYSVLFDDGNTESGSDEGHACSTTHVSGELP